MSSLVQDIFFQKEEDKILFQKKEGGGIHILSDKDKLFFQDEYRDFILTQQLISVVVSRFKYPNIQYEAKCILEKWILSLASSNFSLGRSSIKEKPRWYYKTDLLFDSGYINKQFINQMSKYLKCQKTYYLLNHLLHLINNPPYVHLPLPDKIEINEECLIYGSLRLKLHSRFYMLISRYGLNNFLRMILYYKSLSVMSQHWSIISLEFSKMKKKWNVSNEAYASPINFGMYDIPHSHFCSLNLEVDQPFGSLGRLETISRMEDYGHWTIDPPFIEDIINRGVNIAINHLQRSQKILNLVFMLPYWPESRFFSLLKNSPFFQEDKILNHQDFDFIDFFHNEIFKGHKAVIYIVVLSNIKFFQ